MKLRAVNRPGHGGRQWQLGYSVAGKYVRRFFATKQTAEDEAAKLKEQKTTAGEVWMALTSSERAAILHAHQEASKLGVSLVTLVEDYKHRPPGQQLGRGPTLGDTISELITAKQASGASGDYTSNLGWILGQFSSGRESVRIGAVTHLDVEQFMDTKKLASRSTLRARLSALFRFAVRRGYRSDNPCDRIEPGRYRKPPPAILTPMQAARCLVWLRRHHPDGLAWFALSAFAGLRPEEAEKTQWSAIDLKHGFVRVEAQTSKKGQRRIVYLKPAAVAWLSESKRLRDRPATGDFAGDAWLRRARLPFTGQARKRLISDLRRVLRLPCWPKDVTRHSAASYWLAAGATVGEVATALGNSERVLRRDYLELVTKDHAERFWRLTPKA